MLDYFHNELERLLHYLGYITCKPTYKKKRFHLIPLRKFKKSTTSINYLISPNIDDRNKDLAHKKKKQNNNQNLKMAKSSKFASFWSWIRNVILKNYFNRYGCVCMYVFL